MWYWPAAGGLEGRSSAQTGLSWLEPWYSFNLSSLHDGTPRSAHFVSNLLRREEAQIEMEINPWILPSLSFTDCPIHSVPSHIELQYMISMEKPMNTSWVHLHAWSVWIGYCSMRPYLSISSMSWVYFPSVHMRLLLLQSVCLSLPLNTAPTHFL